jgi:hypothetical protein
MIEKEQEDDAPNDEDKYLKGYGNTVMFDAHRE